ncbi:MAG: DUF1275 family protein [Acetobacteraceae bacterium]|nr:DUF1275 family protein [Acetobacteraceae bacterium]
MANLTALLASRRATFGDLAFAGGLAFLAGATDFAGFSRLGNLFVSFMSGNTTMLGIAIGGGDGARAALILGIIAQFVLGAALGAALERASGRRHPSVVLCVVLVLLAAPLLLPHWTVSALVVAMGALNAAMSRVGAATVSLTYVSGTLVKFGQGLGRVLSGAPVEWTWIWQLPMWMSLLAGVATAKLAQPILGAGALWPLPVVTLLLLLVARRRERR